MANLKEAALAYAREKGWAVFPVKFDKTPYTINGVMDATTDPDQIETWWEQWPRANIAFDVGRAGMMVLDLDPGHNWTELEENVGEVPDTALWATTPRGGEHHFFRIDAGERVAPSASKIAEHVDVRSFNSYVLLAPSRTEDGTYEWQEEGKPSFRTDEMLRVACSARERSEDSDDWIIEPDLPENVALAVKWLQEDAQLAIEGQGGDLMTYKTAAHMKSYGMSAGTAFELIWEHWNPRCLPPWEADGLETKIDHGYAYNTSQPGNITPAYKVAKTASLFKAVVTELPDQGREWNSGAFRVVDRKGMNHISPPEWLIKDFLTRDSYVILFGQSQAFKTFVALDIALSISHGVTSLTSLAPNWPDIASPGKVLYAAGEGRSSITKRVRAWERTHVSGLESDRFVLVDPVPKLSDDNIDLFVRDVLEASPKGYQLVVIDTLSRAMEGVNENAQENASAFTGLAKRLCNELNATVLVLHHTGVGDSKRTRGSSVFTSDADTVLRLDRNEGEYTVRMHMTKQKDGELWQSPKLIELEEIQLQMDPPIKTLVAQKPSKEKIEKAKVEKSKVSEEDTAKTDIIEEQALKILEGNKLKNYSSAALSIVLSALDNRVISVSAQQIAKRYLKPMIGDSDRRIQRCYDPNTQKWRWQN